LLQLHTNQHNSTPNQQASQNARDQDQASNQAQPHTNSANKGTQEHSKGNQKARGHGARQRQPPKKIGANARAGTLQHVLM